MKLVDTPRAILERLSDLGVTPVVLAVGELDGRPYMIQQAVEGRHPDHEWFVANQKRWAAMVSRYLNDSELRRLVSQQRAFWRLDVPAAAALIEVDLKRSSRRSRALRSVEFESAFRRWQSEAATIPSLPMRTIHPDPHVNNYVISEGRPFLLDWDHIDLSDPMRDVGWQIWGGLPANCWPKFLESVEISYNEHSSRAICWWSGFKMLGNALFNDSRNDLTGVRFHLDAFEAAARERGWLERPTGFSASDRLSRDEVHDRDALRRFPL